MIGVALATAMMILGVLVSVNAMKRSAGIGQTDAGLTIAIVAAFCSSRWRRFRLVGNLSELSAAMAAPSLARRPMWVPGQSGGPI